MTTGDLGGIQRVDIRRKDMIAVAVIISSEEPEHITDFFIRTLVQQQYEDFELQKQKAMLKTILDAKKESSARM
ncbi:uncharacterized protein N7525_002399 [Penicillium rubens]|uniref:uncharacterized protein n=1 Tax=Penicillium rubens TaxID=1108849 RepID=UPI002A5AD886|nr:uncharacterized protein N7525_002399 [Penicillium rubens]KAJ5844658.1 hypothetical protein N7525_002399 [Penicillium rubens]